VTITRFVGAADIPVLAALHGACFPEEPWSEKAVAEVLAMPGAFGLAMHEGESDPATGFLLALDLGAECELLALGVHPEARRRGHARRLLADLLAIGDARPLHLEVAEDNAAALALYRGAGFAVVGRRTGYYRRPSGAVAAVLLRRPASP
jgi:[ribosomal protein S18]-alanine N-acetyltransferase